MDRRRSRVLGGIAAAAFLVTGTLVGAVPAAHAGDGSVEGAGNEDGTSNADAAAHAAATVNGDGPVESGGPVHPARGPALIGRRSKPR